MQHACSRWLLHPAQVAQLLWQHSRHYALPRAHHLMRFTTGSSICTFSFRPATQALASLWGVAAYGRPTLPVGALLEMTGAVAALLLPDGNRPDWSLLTSVSAPSLLEVEEPTAASAVECAVTPRTGVLALGSCSASSQIAVHLMARMASLAARSASSRDVPASPASGMLAAIVHQPQTAPLDALAAVAQPPPHATDGFLLSPAVLQAGFTHSACGVPVALGSALLPTMAAAADAAVVGASGSALVSGAARVAAVENVQYKPAIQLAASPDNVKLSEVLYGVEWQAANSVPATLGTAAVAAAQRPLRTARALRSRHPLAPLQLSQVASVAAADVVRVLHSHRTVLQKSFAVHAAGSLPAVPQPGGSGVPAVGVAAVAGVLKNLPFELPFITAQLLDSDAANAQQRDGRAYALSSTPLPGDLAADLYGVAVRGGVLFRPRLSYRNPLPDGGGAALQRLSSTFMVTGGLGGLGLLTASWMAGLGAPSLLLLSRSGLASNAADAVLITQCPALMSVAKCDVSISEDARQAVAVAHTLSWPLGGIMHAAGLQVGCCACLCCRWLALPHSAN